MEQHSATLWESIADATPNALALVHGPRAVTWSAFDERAARLAAALSSHGVGPGCPVAINLYNCPEWLETFFAVLKIRAVPVSINYRYTDHELAYLFENSDAKAVVFHRSLADRVQTAAAAVPAIRLLVAVDDASGVPDADDTRGASRALDYEQLLRTFAPTPRIDRSPDDIMMFYTGGTTGLPKGIITPIGAYTDVLEMSAAQLRALSVARSEPAETSLDPTADPVEVARALHECGATICVLAASPLMHSTALGLLAAPALRTGGTVVMLERRPFDPHEFLATIERHRVAVTALVGDAFARPIVQALEEGNGTRPYDLSSLAFVFSAGVVFSADTKRRFLVHAPNLTIVEYCGSSEGAFIGSKMIRAGDPELTGVFTAGPGLKILDAAGRPLPPGVEEPGLIASPTGMLGYYKDPEKTAQHFRDIDGVLHVVTGDVAVLHSDGTVLLLGRGSSVINTGGEKVFPDEVEDSIKALLGVLDCLVIGQPDERLGEIVTAVVDVIDGGPTADDIGAHVRSRLAGYKVPKQIVLAPVPRLANGKPDFAAARQIVACTGHPPDPNAAARPGHPRAGTGAST